jgi:integrase
MNPVSEVSAMPAILPIRPVKVTPPDRRFVFTPRRLESFPVPPTGFVMLTDARTPDLRCMITAGGTRTFCVYRKLAGRPVRVLIGPHPTLDLDTARKLARETAAKMVQGIDPREAKREARTAATFGELATDFLERHAKKRREKTRHEYERQLDTYLRSWNSRPLPSIRRDHVAALHAKLERDHGPYTANRVLALLSSMFTFAERERHSTGVNPCRGVKRAPETKRERFIQPDEMPKFLAAVDAEPSQQIRDYVLVSLFTGARRKNVLAMRWADLDFNRKTWAIPGVDSKSGRSMVLPLVPQVVAILKARPRTGEYVFPSRVSGVGHMKDPMGGWRSILRRAGLSDLRPHDLRRTFGSWMAAGGTSLPIIGKSLGHSDPSATAIYARLHLDPVRQAAEAAAAAMAGAGKAVKK